MQLTSICEGAVLYVDEDVCTGCELCVATCAQGAISMHGSTSCIDQSRCTLCGRCADVCPTGAIIIMEIDPERYPLSAAGTHPENRAAGVVPTAPHRPAQSGSTSPAPPQPRFDAIERVLAGLFTVAAFALDHRRSGSTWLPRLVSRATGEDRSKGSRADSCPAARGAGQGERGLGRRRGRAGQCRARGRNRTT